MNPIELYEMLKPKPFQPVRVYCKDGRTFDVHWRELLIVGVDYLSIGIPAPGETLPIYDRVVDLDLNDVERVERLAEPAATKAR